MRNTWIIFRRELASYFATPPTQLVHALHTSLTQVLNAGPLSEPCQCAATLRGRTKRRAAAHIVSPRITIAAGARRRMEKKFCLGAVFQ